MLAAFFLSCKFQACDLVCLICGPAFNGLCIFSRPVNLVEQSQIYAEKSRTFSQLAVSRPTGTRLTNNEVIPFIGFPLFATLSICCWTLVYKQMATRGRCPNDGAENNAINYANSSLPRVKTEIMTSELRDTERERECMLKAASEWWIYVSWPSTGVVKLALAVHPSIRARRRCLRWKIDDRLTSGQASCCSTVASFVIQRRRLASSRRNNYTPVSCMCRVWIISSTMTTPRGLYVKSHQSQSKRIFSFLFASLLSIYRSCPAGVSTMPPPRPDIHYRFPGDATMMASCVSYHFLCESSLSSLTPERWWSISTQRFWLTASQSAQSAEDCRYRFMRNYEYHSIIVARSQKRSKISNLRWQQCCHLIWLLQQT